jgi:hypothetical protein
MPDFSYTERFPGLHRPEPRLSEFTDDCGSDPILNRALQAIEKGVLYALQHRRHGLCVRIHTFRVHEVDFRPSMYFLHTYYYTRRQLELGDQACLS